MKYIIAVFLFATLSLWSCVPSQQAIQTTKQATTVDTSKILIPTLFGDKWQQLNPIKHDSVVSFAYLYNNDIHDKHLRIFISKTTNKAIVFRHGSPKEISPTNPSIYQFPLNNPFTGRRDVIHIFQNDTLELDIDKWNKWQQHINQYPISGYSQVVENTTSESEHGSFRISLSYKNNFSVYRSQQIMEDEFKEMCELLFELINIKNIPLDRTPRIDLSENPLVPFDNLVGGIWEIDTKWANGDAFHQLHKYEWSLEHKIVKLKVYNWIDDGHCSGEELRNEGVRAFNSTDKIINFWDFDIHGSITTGTCIIDGKNIEYVYEYEGQTIHDTWTFVNPNQYQFAVELEKGGKRHLLLEGLFNRKF